MDSTWRRLQSEGPRCLYGKKGHPSFLRNVGCLPFLPVETDIIDIVFMEYVSVARPQECSNISIAVSGQGHELE